MAGARPLDRLHGRDPATTDAGRNLGRVLGVSGVQIVENRSASRALTLRVDRRRGADIVQLAVFVERLPDGIRVVVAQTRQQALRDARSL